MDETDPATLEKVENESDEGTTQAENKTQSGTPSKQRRSPVKSPANKNAKVVKDQNDNGESGDDTSDVENKMESGTPEKEQKSPAKSPVNKRQKDKKDDDGSENEESDDDDKAEDDKSKSPSRSPSKRRDKESESDNEESDEEDSEDEERLPPGLLEQPLEVDGKRSKKKVERLKAEVITPKDKDWTIEEGKGKKLGDIEVVEFNLQKTKSMDCKPLHHVLFGKIGKLLDVKRNIRQFSGEPNGKSSKEHEKRMIHLNYKLGTNQLKEFCTIFNLERGGTKADLIDRLEKFILKPVDYGENIYVKKGGKLKRKRSSKTPDGEKPQKGKKQKVKAKKKPKKEESDENESEDEKKEKVKTKKRPKIEESDDESEVESPKKKKAKLSPAKKSTPTPKKKTKTKSSTPKKTPKENGKKQKSPKKTPKKSPKKSPKKKKEEELSDLSGDSSSDDEPLARLKEPTPPSDSEITALVKKLLKDADLETVTMKTVVKQVFAKYPKFDLSNRKDFIKDAVRKIIS